jgi:Rieske Fe-S protein
VTEEPQRDTRASRRGVLAGVGLVGLAGAVSACGSGGSGGSGSSGSSAGGAAAGGALATTSEIPVGSGKIFSGEKVVVTQPESGEFKAFSAVCTHMGCMVATISDGTIDCPCHGSQYSIATGAVVGGPAPRPLPAQPIKVSGSSIFLS